MLYSEIIAVCSQIHTKHINTRRVQKETELFKWRANQHRQRAAATERP